MAELFSVIVSALRADQSRLEQASVNASNASTPGFKRSALVSVSFDHVLASREAGAVQGTPGEAQGRMRKDGLPALPVLQKITDFSAGGLVRTGRSLDVSVEGKAFIAVTDGSRTWLTRTASMQVNAEGELVGPKGLRVVGHEGEMRPGTDQDLSFDASGQLTRGDQVIGRLRLWEPMEDVVLSSGDGVLFETSQDHLREAELDANVVRGGFLEGSNTSNLREMLGVMESVRHFESLIRLAQGYDEALGKAIQKLGEV